MQLPDVISGAGGGKGGGSGGGLNEQPDSLKSTSYAQVLDLVSEGEIVGLVNGLKSIYVDDTPVQNSDGTMNFTSVSYIATTGTQSQSSIAGFDQTLNEVAVGVEFKTTTPITRTITSTSVNAVVVTVQFPQLTNLDSKGNLLGTSVEYAIDIQNNGGGFVNVIDNTVTGKSSSTYEKQHRIQLPAGGPWDIRVRRITADSASGSLNNKTYLKSYTEVVDAKLRYPNSALIGVRVDASQFRSVPKRGYEVKLLKIKIPSNATVRADGSLTYAGNWDGTFQVAWSCCPAWAFYDMLTNSRYGLGQFISAAQVDKWAMYSISQYCNALVSDGFGGTEPRFTCNIYIDTQKEAFQWVQDMASIFRGMPYWGTGTVTAVQDAPANPTYLFHNGNVADGLFTYQGSSAKSRHTVALVTWNDPADMYRQKVEYVEDTTGIARYGVVPTQVVAVGCTSRGQANRVGRWLLYTERYEKEIVTFKVAAEGNLLAPGAIIKVADQYRAGVRYGGRISSATTNTVTVDSLAATPSLPATLYITAADGTVSSYTVSGISGNVITISGTFSAIPPAQAPWIVATGTVAEQTFRVISSDEQDDGSFEINALTHYSGKFNAVENNLTIVPRTFTALNVMPATPTNISATEYSYLFQNTSRSKISVKWDAQATGVKYVVQWRYNSGNFTIAEAYTADFEIVDTLPGTYEIRVTAVNQVGKPSPSYASVTLTATGKATAPAAPSDLTATGGVDGIALKWTNPDVATWSADIYENTTNNSATSTKIARVSGSNYTRSGLNKAAGTMYYWVKLVDTSANSSSFSNVASASATAGLLASRDTTTTRSAVASPPVNPQVGDLWIQIDNNNATFRYDSPGLIIGGTTVTIGGVSIDATWIPQLDQTAVSLQSQINAQAVTITDNVTALNAIQSDGILARGEKPEAIRQYTVITQEYAVWVARASALSITTELTAYASAYNALVAYVGTVPNFFDTTSDTAITASAFSSAFTTYYAARQALAAKIDGVAATTATWATVTGTGRPADYATKNTVTYSATAPLGPTAGDLWVDTSVNPNVFRTYDGAAWQAGANLTTNTTQLLDGANLGGTAAWSGVSGTGKPEDSADVTSAITGAPVVNVNASYTGAITDALPRTVVYQLIRQGADVSGSTTWSVSVVSGTIAATISGGTLSLNTSGGSFTSSKVRITAVYGATTRTFDVAVNVVLAPAPNTGTGGGTSASGNVNGTVASTSMVAVGDVLTVTVGSGGQVALSANYNFTVATGSGTFHMSAQWYRWNGSAYVAIGSSVADTVGYISTDGSPGEGLCSYTDTGLTVSSSQKYRLYLADTTNTNTRTVSGTCAAVGS